MPTCRTLKIWCDDLDRRVLHIEPSSSSTRYELYGTQQPGAYPNINGLDAGVQRWHSRLTTYARLSRLHRCPTYFRCDASATSKRMMLAVDHQLSPHLRPAVRCQESGRLRKALGKYSVLKRGASELSPLTPERFLSMPKLIANMRFARPDMTLSGAPSGMTKARKKTAHVA